MIRFLLLCVSLFSTSAFAQDGVLIRCGASEGRGYFFHEPVGNPEGPEWSDDALSNGKIILVKLGEEWDIQFDDSVGAYSYRQDGGTVILLGQTEKFIMIGAFFNSSYADIYTFDFDKREVAWTSSKIGGPISKAAVYRAQCE